MRQILLRLPLPGTDHVLTLYGYGAMMCLGFLAAILVAARRARGLKQPPEIIYNAALAAFFGGVFGGRLFYVIQYSGGYWHWWDIVKIWEGGLTYYGGLIVGAVAVIAYLRFARAPVLYWIDIIAPSLALGLAFGRVGCFLNGCCYGAPSDLPWAFAWPVGSIPWHHYAERFLASHGAALVSFSGPRLGAATGAAAAVWQMPRIHPSQLYSLANALFLFVLLHLLFARKRRHGQVFFTFLLLYAVSRFLLECTRADEAWGYLLGLPTLLKGLGMEEAAARLPGLSISQNVAIVMAVVSGAALVWLFRSRRRELAADYAPPAPRREADHNASTKSGTRHVYPPRRGGQEGKRR